MLARFRSHYGASPIHLLAHLILLPIVAWALLTVLDFRAARNVVLWLVCAVILHDLILLPLYSTLDWLARGLSRSAINYVRVPAGLSLLMLLVFWSTIRGKGTGNFHFTSGLSYHGYFSRWLLVTAGMFALSGALLLARRAGFPRRTPRSAPSSKA
jgi:hypothetical protein